MKQMLACARIRSGRRIAGCYCDLNFPIRDCRDATDIGHMKTDGLLGRNSLAGEMGDAMQAKQCGAVYNQRPLPAHLRVRTAAVITGLTARLRRSPHPNFGGLLAVA